MAEVKLYKKEGTYFNKEKQKDSCERGALALHVEVHVYFDQ